jgi:polar amino acid transport system permease protein
MLSVLLQGSVISVKVTVLASLLAWTLAFLAGTLRVWSRGPVAWLAVVYVEVFRGTSALAQLFFVFFALPLLGVTLSPLWAGVIALGLNTGAYGAEIVRGAINAVPRGQLEAAQALGLSRATTFRRVVLPIAVPSMLPSICNNTVDLLKNSALVSLITLADLTAQADRWRLTSGEGTAPYVMALVIYFLMSTVVVEIFRQLERRATRFRRAGSPTAEAGVP